jgi:hypothetical protein
MSMFVITDMLSLSVSSPIDRLLSELLFDKFTEVVWLVLHDVWVCLLNGFSADACALCGNS